MQHLQSTEYLQDHRSNNHTIHKLVKYQLFSILLAFRSSPNIPDQIYCIYPISELIYILPDLNLLALHKYHMEVRLPQACLPFYNPHNLPGQGYNSKRSSLLFFFLFFFFFLFRLTNFCYFFLDVNANVIIFFAGC